MKKRLLTIVWIVIGILCAVIAFWLGSQLFRTDIVVTNDELFQMDEKPWAEVSSKNPTSSESTSQATELSTEHIWDNADGSQLYRPPEKYFCDQYVAYVYCTDTSIQKGYVKMRNGPSSKKFGIAYKKIPDFEAVNVEVKNLDGWSLCIYDGTEGWIRSRFLFNETEIEQFR